MASIRLTESQIKYLRERGGCLTLYAGIERFKNGELVIEKRDYSENTEKLLPFSLNKPIKNFTAYQVRAILNAHIRNPVFYGDEIKKLNSWIDASFSGSEYILEEVKS